MGLDGGFNCPALRVQLAHSCRISLEFEPLNLATYVVLVTSSGSKPSCQRSDSWKLQRIAVYRDRKAENVVSRRCDGRACFCGLTSANFSLFRSKEYYCPKHWPVVQKLNRRFDAEMHKRRHPVNRHLSFAEEASPARQRPSSFSWPIIGLSKLHPTVRRFAHV